MENDKKCTEINNNTISAKESCPKRGKKSKCVCGKEVKFNKKGIPHGNHLRKQEKCASHYAKPNGKCVCRYCFLHIKKLMKSVHIDVHIFLT